MEELVYSIKFIDQSQRRVDKEKFVLKVVMAEIPICIIYEDDFAEFEMTFTDRLSGFIHKHVRKPHITDCTIKPWSFSTNLSLKYELELYKELFISFMKDFDKK